MTRFQRLTAWLIARAHRRAPDFIIGDKAAPYLRRWWLIPRNPLFNIYLHEILRSDTDRALHDHPWINVSIILDGGYIERVPKRQGQMSGWDYVEGYTHDIARVAGDRVYRMAHWRHRLIVPAGDRCWSLFITGPVYRRWGFHCRNGWVYWEDFVDPNKPGEVGRGCGEQA